MKTPKVVMAMPMLGTTVACVRDDDERRSDEVSTYSKECLREQSSHLTGSVLAMPITLNGTELCKHLLHEHANGHEGRANQGGHETFFLSTQTVLADSWHDVLQVCVNT